MWIKNTQVNVICMDIRSGEITSVAWRKWKFSHTMKIQTLVNTTDDNIRKDGDRRMWKAWIKRR